MALVVKILPGDAGDMGDVGLIHGSGRSLGERNVNPLQYYCLQNPMGRGAWQVTVHRVTKSQTQMKRLHTHTHPHPHMRDLGILERDSSPILCLASSVVVLEINSQLGVLQKFKARPP